MRPKLAPPCPASTVNALHADHVYPLTEESLRRIDTLEMWIAELRRIDMVICVTAEENYRLELIEKAGVTGPAKYAKARVELATPALPWDSELPRPPSSTQIARLFGLWVFVSTCSFLGICLRRRQGCFEMWPRLAGPAPRSTAQLLTIVTSVKGPASRRVPGRWA